MTKLKVYILFFLTALPNYINAQQYKTVHVKHVGDSILRKRLGDSLFKFVKYDTDTYYEYKTSTGESEWETLDEFENTKGDFVEVDIRWDVKIPYPKCSSFDTIKGKTSFVLNSKLKPKEKPYLKFIPRFFWNNSPCNLISKEDAISIASKKFKEKGIEPITAYISYDPYSKKFTWSVSNILSRSMDWANNAYGLLEIVELEAVKGKIFYYSKSSYGACY